MKSSNGKTSFILTIAVAVIARSQAFPSAARNVRPVTGLSAFFRRPTGYSENLGMTEMGPPIDSPLATRPATDGPMRRDIRRGRFDRYEMMPLEDRAVREDAVRRGRGSMESYGPTTMGPTVQGGSLRTFTKGYNGRRPDDKTMVEFGTDGRPLHGNFEVWDGPDNAPSRVNLFSQDGYNYRFRMVTGHRNNPYQSETYQVRNNGPLEFPMRANVGSVQYNYDHYGSSQSVAGYGHGTVYERGYGSGYDRGYGNYFRENGQRTGRPLMRDYSSYMSSSSPDAKTIQGGSNKCWTLGPRVESVKVELHSQGMPIMARVELLQGPNNVKSLAEIYQQDGHQRPFVAVLDTPGWNKGSIRIVNDGPMAFPITASVQPYETH